MSNESLSNESLSNESLVELTPCYFCESTQHKSEDCNNLENKSPPRYNYQFTLELGPYIDKKSFFIKRYTDFDNIKTNFIRKLINYNIINSFSQFSDNRNSVTYIESIKNSKFNEEIDYKNFDISEINFQFNRNSIFLNIFFDKNIYKIPLLYQKNLLSENGDLVEAQIRSLIDEILDISNMNQCIIL